MKLYSELEVQSIAAHIRKTCGGNSRVEYRRKLKDGTEIIVPPNPHANSKVKNTESAREDWWFHY